MILKKWVLRESAAVPPFFTEHLTKAAAGLLAQRGIGSEEALRDFLGEHTLTDPMTLPDMEKAVRRVSEAAEREESVLIFGDYDADGVCATAILWDYLHNLGVQTAFCLPTRADGYGLNKQVVKSAAAQGFSLLLCVDNGISCNEEVSLANELGLDVVILDHHQPGETLPDAAAVVDAHRKDALCREEARQLCGAAVVLLFVAAMEGDSQTALDQYAHLAALATVGDIMPLQGDSRMIVQAGLETLRYTDHGGLCALMELSGVEKSTLSAQNLGFGLVPRINAAGRMGNPTDALRLILEEDREAAEPMAAKICTQNQERRHLEETVFQQIEQQIALHPELVHRRVGFFVGEGWNRGVIGIAAAKLVQRYGKPVFLVDVGPDGAVSSARSFEGFSIFDALCSAAPYLTRFGGHTGAGGFACPAENLADVQACLEAYAEEHFPVMPLPEQTIDSLMEPEDLTVENIRGLEILEPCGAGNEAPVFEMENVVIRRVYPLSDGRFVRFEGSRRGKNVYFVLFYQPFDAFPFAPGDRVDILFSPSVRSYRGSDSVSCKCMDIRPHGFPYAVYHLGLAQYENFCRGRQLTPQNAAKCLPSREDFRAIWIALSGMPQLQRNKENLFFRLYPRRIGYAKICFAVQIMTELGLAHDTPEGIYLEQPSGKADYASAPTYRKLEAQTASL